MAKLPSKVTQFDNKMLEMLDGEFWNFAGTSFSFPELSHRSKYFADLNTQLTDLLRTHFNVPANYQILFLHNGLQYCSIPFNLLPIVQGTALYLVSTLLDSSSPCSSLNPYSSQAYLYASKLSQGVLQCATAYQLSTFLQTHPNQKPYYLHYNLYETQHGLQTLPLPADSDKQILVCNIDYISHYSAVDISRHGVVYFYTGKGLGLVGQCVMFVRQDLIGKELPTTPDLMSFYYNLRMKSVINTPFTFGFLMLLRQLYTMRKQGFTREIMQGKLAEVKREYVQALEKKGIKTLETGVESMLRIVLKGALSSQLREYLYEVSPNEYVLQLQLTNRGSAGQFVSLLVPTSEEH